MPFFRDLSTHPTCHVDKTMEKDNMFLQKNVVASILYFSVGNLIFDDQLFDIFR